MTFTTLTFLLFLPLVFALHWLLQGRRSRNVLLLIASYVFYGWWDWRFCGLMLLSSLIDYVAGWAIGATESAGKRRGYLTAAMCGNLAILGVFKYFNFFADSLQGLGEQVGWQFDAVTLSIVLPVGISFYTFQTMSYTIDVYRRQLEPTRDLIDFLTFVSFFPQLVAGPIERASDLLPQIANARTFDGAAARAGGRLILWGLFKKLVIADRLAIFVDPCFADPAACSRAVLVLATVGFAYQIYCDFSAYSDMATGTASLFGVKLSRNFAYPYFSQSIPEFWRRWHISLSTWFRDYLYIPLGGNRGSVWRRHLNLVITFLVSGLWHGAAWQFLIWGGAHGVAAAGTKAAGWSGEAGPDAVPGGPHLIPRPLTLLKMAATFCLVCLAWVFFRAASMDVGFSMARRLLEAVVSRSTYTGIVSHLASDATLGVTFLLLAAFVLVEWLQRRRRCPLEIHAPTSIRWAMYTLLIWGTLWLMPSASSRPFIYFNF